jgi:CDP-paratose synthetase
LNILLTGGTGFLGSDLLKRFLNKGHNVTLIKRSFSSIHRIKNCISDIHSIDIDKNHIESILDEKKPFDCIVHTATSYGLKGENILDIVNSNLIFPLNLLNKAVESGTMVFINTSTALNRLLNSYSLTKKQFEEWGKILSGNSSLKFINIKLEYMYGHDDPDKFATNVIDKLMTNAEVIDLTNGEQERDFIFIEDILDAYEVLLDNIPEDSGYHEYGLGSGRALKVRDFVETAKKIIGSKTTLGFGNVPYRKHECMFSQADISKLNDLGWFPSYSIEKGIQEIIRKRVHPV